MRRRLLHFLDEHLGVALSVATAFLVGVRVMAASAWDQNTALVVLETQGPPAVIAGTLIGLIPMVPLAVGMVIMTVFDPRRDEDVTHSSLGWALVFVAGLALLSLTMIPWPAALTIVIVMVVMIFIASQLGRRSRRRGLESGPKSKEGRGRLGRTKDSMLLVTGLLLLLVVMAAPYPWLPAEQLDRKTGLSRTVVGYVLAETDKELIVLTNKPRGVERLRSASYDRAFCDPSSSSDNWMSRATRARPVLAMLVGRSVYEKCPRQE